MGFVEEFVFQNYCRPILDYSGYNFINTLTYGAILLAVAFFVFLPVLRKLGIKFDYRFALAVLAFVLFGSTFRILEDLKVLPRSCSPLEFSFYTISPGVYILIGLITFAVVLATHWLSKKSGIAHYKILGASGLIFAAPFVYFSIINFKNPLFFFLIIALTLILAIIAFFAARHFKKEFAADNLNLIAVAGQALDGTATFVATQLLSCGEQHPVSNAILGFFPIGFILIKIALAFLIVYYIDKEVMDANTRVFLKIVIMVLGFAPGLRDTFTVGVGTCN